MKYFMHLLVTVGLLISLAGCATEPLKAPCDNHGHFCGRKIKINQW